MYHLSFTALTYPLFTLRTVTGTPNVKLVDGNGCLLPGGGSKPGPSCIGEVKQSNATVRTAGMKKLATVITATTLCSLCWAHFFSAPPTKPTFSLEQAMAKADSVISNAVFRCKSASWAGVNLSDNPTPKEGGLWRLTFTDGTHGRLIEVRWDGTLRVPSPYRDRTVLPETTAREAHRAVVRHLAEQPNAFVYDLWTYGKCWSAKVWDLQKNDYSLLHVVGGTVLSETEMRERMKKDGPNKTSEAIRR